MTINNAQNYTPYLPDPMIHQDIVELPREHVIDQASQWRLASILGLMTWNLLVASDCSVICFLILRCYFASACEAFATVFLITL